MDSINEIEVENSKNKKWYFYLLVVYTFIAVFFALIFYGSILVVPVVAMLWNIDPEGLRTLGIVILGLFVLTAFVLAIIVCSNVEKYRRYIRTSLYTLHFFTVGLPVIALTLFLLVRPAVAMMNKVDRWFFRVLDKSYPSEVYTNMTKEYALELVEKTENQNTLKNLKNECETIARIKRGLWYKKIAKGCDLKSRMLKLQKKFDGDMKKCLDDPIYISLKDFYDELCIEVKFFDSV